MKIPYYSKPDYKKLENKNISIIFPQHTREGLFLKSPQQEDFQNKFQYRLIYQESQKCIKEILLTINDLIYVSPNTIKSKNAPVWIHHKELIDCPLPNNFNELEKLLNDNKNK